MLKCDWLPGLAVAGIAVVAAGCGSAARQERPRIPVPPPVASAPAPAPTSAPDPVQALIDESQKHYLAGQKELEVGHIDGARVAFNRAIDVLLAAPGGARTEPRLREQFDRLVDRISALEVATLAAGDGFSEKPTEPASIDALFDLAPPVETAPTPAVAAAVETDLARAQHDIPIPMNQRVLNYVEAFQGRLRGFIQEGLERGSQYLPMIQSVFRAEGLPLDLAYVPLIESAFKTNALSRAKAKGVWQFMRPTATENGLKQDWYVDERSDPYKATVAAAKYLKTLGRMFDGDWHLALASYNGGPGRVQRAMKRYGKDDFWSLSAKPRQLPRETREYVPMILAAVIIARNPAQYGFTVPDASDAPAHEVVTVNGPLDLRHVAEWTGTPVDAIQQLNPELRRWTTPVRAQSYDLKVPTGRAEMLRQRLDDAEQDERGALNWHTVRSGETIATIARKLRVKRADLAEANYLSLRSRVRPGQKLIIPRAPAVLMASQPDRPTPAVEVERGRTVQRASLVSEAADNASPASSDRVRKVYRVKRGDTLSSIARLFETSVSALKQWNRLRSNRINPGQRLTVYTGSGE
jgi:membrane-bound lytic murein transglycosylase D